MTLRNTPIELQADADLLTGRGDPQQRYRIYRLCVCFECLGVGKVMDRPKGNQVKPVGPNRCEECRGEGKTLELVATAGTPQDVGVALIELAQEGEFEDCPIGILEDGGSWLIKPWLPSPRNVADAARVMAQSKRKGESKMTVLDTIYGHEGNPGPGEVE